MAESKPWIMTIDTSSFYARSKNVDEVSVDQLVPDIPEFTEIEGHITKKRGRPSKDGARSVLKAKPPVLKYDKLELHEHTHADFEGLPRREIEESTRSAIIHAHNITEIDRVSGNMISNQKMHNRIHVVCHDTRYSLKDRRAMIKDILEELTLKDIDEDYVQ